MSFINTFTLIFINMLQLNLREIVVDHSEQRCALTMVFFFVRSIS